MAKKVKPRRIVFIVLIIIGGLTVLDNTWRLGRELGNAIGHTLSTHRWNMVVIK